jgi:NAD(P)-dependent dehydrogenase (short-subunit alcohol dehydrogenase family)
MSDEFRNLHVVVTGGGGALGGAVTELLLDQGAICHLPLRDAGTAGRLGKLASDRVHTVGGVELTSEASVAGFYARLPGLWASIHCAGGFAAAPIGETSLDEFSGMWTANALTCFLCCREAVGAIRRAGKGGRIVNVAARPASEPRTGAGMIAYTVGKAAVCALTEALAEEVAPERIWVNAIAPSILDTEVNRRSMPSAEHDRWVKVAEVASTIAHLASPINRSARGGVVPVYGSS